MRKTNEEGGRKAMKQQGDLQVQTKEILPAGFSKSFIFP
jgi:hypothetical protein